MTTPLPLELETQVVEALRVLGESEPTEVSVVPTVASVARDLLTSGMEVLGLASIVAGAWLFDLRAGLISLGLALLLLGFLLGES